MKSLFRAVFICGVLCVCQNARGLTIREDANLYQKVYVEGTVEGESANLPVEVVVGPLSSATVSFTSSVIGRSAYLGSNRISTPEGGTITRNTTYGCGVYVESTKLGRTASLEVEFHIKVNYTYTVEFDVTGGSGRPSSKTIGAKMTMSSVSPPSRDGYEFLGFYTEKNGGGTQYFAASGACVRQWNEKSGATLYAAWKLAGTPVSLTVTSPVSEVRSGNFINCTCKIAYDNGSSQTSSSLPEWTIVDGAAYARISSSGVLTAEEVTTQQRVTVRASYKGLTSPLCVVTVLPRSGYAITYAPGSDGRGQKVCDVKLEGRDLTLRGGLFRRTGYRQIRWETVQGERYPLRGTYAADSDVTLYPVWSTNEWYSITFAPGADGEGEAVTFRKPTGVDMILQGAIFKRRGFRQTGWAYREGGDKAFDLGARYDRDDEDMFREHMILYPVWERRQQYTMTFSKAMVFFNEEVITTAVAYEGEPYRLPGNLASSDQTGWWTLAGGLLGGGEVDYLLEDVVYPTSGMTFYPLTEYPTPTANYTVTCQPDEYSVGPINNYTRYCKSCLILPGALYERTGYVQTGWRDSSGNKYGLSQPYRDGRSKTLLPDWTADLVITYRLGSESTESPVRQYQGVGKSIVISQALWTRENQVQTGWATRENGERVYGLGEACSFSKDTVLYPYWDGESEPPPSEFTITEGRLTAYDGPGGDVVIPAEVSSIANDRNAFRDRDEITSIVIPDGVATLDVSTFSGCVSLTNAVLGSGVRELWRAAFGYCFALQGIVLPNNVTYVGMEAFAYCQKLRYAVIGYGVETIDEDAFVGCESLRMIYAPKCQHARVRAALLQSGLDVSKVSFYDYDAPDARHGGLWSVAFEAAGGEGAMPTLSFSPNRVVKLPQGIFTRSGKRFAGWACSNGRRYDDGMLVFDLAKPGEIVTMTAIWE